MKRREFITLLGGAAILSRPVEAQPSLRARHVVLLMGSPDDTNGQIRVRALRSGLNDRGWIEGRNAQIDVRWAMGETALLHAQAAEMVALQPDVIFVDGTRTLDAVRQLTKTIPIVFVGSDPVAQGFVESMARPGGNITGFLIFEHSMIVKLLEVLKELAPQTERVALMTSSDSNNLAGRMRALEDAAPYMRVKPVAAPIRNAADIERTIVALIREPHTGILIGPDNTVLAHENLIFRLAALHKLPVIYPERSVVVKGGLASYGADVIDVRLRAASYIDRILKGENPAELPVQAPTKFELTINLKTAKALGLDVPATLLARADEVIE
jgi:putative ABC transport system substrate-binding protein